MSDIKTYTRTTGTRVRWQEFGGWKPWMDCWRADIENDCLRIVTKNTLTVWAVAPDQCTETDDEVTLIPLHVIRGRIEIKYETQEDE